MYRKIKTLFRKRTDKLGMVVRACNLRTKEVEQRGKETNARAAWATNLRFCSRTKQRQKDTEKAFQWLLDYKDGKLQC